MMPLVIAVISLIAAKKKSQATQQAAAQQAAIQPSVAPAGWYACPWNNTMLRWWDGQQWTGYTAQINIPVSA